MKAQQQDELIVGKIFFCNVSKLWSYVERPVPVVCNRRLIWIFLVFLIFEFWEGCLASPCGQLEVQRWFIDLTEDCSTKLLQNDDDVGECFAIALFSPELNIFSCREAADSRTLPPGGWGQSLVGADHQEGICNIIQYYLLNHQESIFQKYFFTTTKIVFQIVLKKFLQHPNNICLLRCTGLLLPLVTRLVLTAPPQVTLIEVGTSICIVMIVTIIANAIIWSS